MNKIYKYILVLSLLIAACDLHCLEGCPEETDAPTILDVASDDVRNYHEDTLDVRGPDESDAVRIKEPEVSVSTDFPAPNWFF